MLRKVTGACCAVLFLLGAGSVPAVAAGGFNPCEYFIANQKSRTDVSVSLVKILGINDANVAGVMILGLPRFVSVTVNGIDVSHLKSDSRQVMCSGRAVGELSSYDLSSLRMDAGVLEVRADGKSASRQVILRR